MQTKNKRALNMQVYIQMYNLQTKTTMCRQSNCTNTNSLSHIYRKLISSVPLSLHLLLAPLHSLLLGVTET